MAIQTTPHTNTEQDVSSAAMDLEPNMNPQDVGRGDDAKTYEIADGAQTGGTRAFHATAERDNLPKSFDEGTGATASDGPQLPTGDTQGITNSPGTRERDTQEKVLGK